MQASKLNQTNQIHRKWNKKCLKFFKFFLLLLLLQLRNSLFEWAMNPFLTCFMCVPSSRIQNRISSRQKSETYLWYDNFYEPTWNLKCQTYLSHRVAVDSNTTLFFSFIVRPYTVRNVSNKILSSKIFTSIQEMTLWCEIMVSLSQCFPVFMHSLRWVARTRTLLLLELSEPKHFSPLLCSQCRQFITARWKLCLHLFN